MAAIYGKAYIFGLCATKPAKVFTPGKLRWRRRRADFLRAQVHRNGRIREFIVKEEDGFWVNAGEIQSCANGSITLA